MTAETGSKFDPNPYLITLKSKQYLEVKFRLLWIRSEHPDAIIDTELKEHAEGYAMFKAFVAIPEGGSATGWGSEEASDFPDYLEKAETKAIGRALAALGYGTQFCEDHTFADDSHPGRVVDSPGGRPAASNTTAQRPQAPSAPSQGASNAFGGPRCPQHPNREPRPSKGGGFYCSAKLDETHYCTWKQAANAPAQPTAADITARGQAAPPRPGPSPVVPPAPELRVEDLPPPLTPQVEGVLKQIAGTLTLERLTKVEEQINKYDWEQWETDTALGALTERRVALEGARA